MMRLKIQSAESEATRVLEVPDGDFEWTLGRSPTCTVVLEGTGISRRHARISRSGTGDILLEDTDSTAGTTLNGRPLSAATAFRQHDTAGIGPWVLQLEVDQEVRPEARRPRPELRPHPRGPSRPAACRLQGRVHPLHATHPRPGDEQQHRCGERIVPKGKLPLLIRSFFFLKNKK